MGKHAFTMSKGFSWENTASSYEKLFREVLEKG